MCCKNSWLWIICLLTISTLATAQVNSGNLRLNEQWNGNYTYTMFGNSLLAGPNQLSGYCDILESSSATLKFDSSLHIKKAYLYYAATGEVIKDVSLNDQPATFLINTTYAPAQTSNYSYFFAKADVTEIVKSQGEGEYTFSGLQGLNRTKSEYCYEAKKPGVMCPANGDLFAGWAVLVIFEDDQLPFNSISIFDGYHIVNTEFLPQMGVNTSDVSEASFSFLSWEGDTVGANEWITINGRPLENDLNSYPNQIFNQTNTFTNERPLWAMDLDYFQIDDYLDSTTRSLDIQMESSGTCADFTLLQVAVLSIENRLPNPSIELNSSQPNLCGFNDIELTFTVSNENTTEVLPAGIPIYFYEKVHARPLLDSVFTTQPLNPNETIEMTKTITLNEIRFDFTEIEAIINVNENGKPFTPELNPADNQSFIRVEEIGKIQLFFSNIFSPNGDGVNDSFYLLNRTECGKNISEFSLTIFDRWGNEVRKLTSIQEEWDGRQEKEKKSGLFLWSAEFTSSKTNKRYAQSGTVYSFF